MGDSKIAAEKRELRRKMKERIKQIPIFEQEEQSRLVCKSIFESELFLAAGAVFGYLAMKGELCVDSIVERGLLLQKDVFVPKIDAQSGKMEFCRLTGAKIDGQVRIGEYGIREPIGRGDADIAFVQKPVLVIVPGLAFSAEGKRLGRGKGYYDRWLGGALGKCVACGVCFAEQLVEYIPTDLTDKSVDIVATPQKIYQLSR